MHLKNEVQLLELKAADWARKWTRRWEPDFEKRSSKIENQQTHNDGVDDRSKGDGDDPAAGAVPPGVAGVW